MALHPFADVNIHSTHFQVLEQFTVFLYDKTSDVEHVNEARKVLFCQKERTMENYRMPCCNTLNVLLIKLEYCTVVVRVC